MVQGDGSQDQGTDKKDDAPGFGDIPDPALKDTDAKVKAVDELVSAKEKEILTV